MAAISSYDGILVIAKPAGWTSHDVVAKVRKLLGVRRTGHAGTLDPMATGVLLVCVGKSTRLSEYLMAGVKEYHATARLGIETDTYDSDGQILSEQPVRDFSWEEIDSALQAFSGETWQVPPAYSAIKSGGVPAHRRARRGEEVVLPARRIVIHQVRLMRWENPELKIEIRCDPGTYVRSLTHDLGARLGCGAVLTSLSRTRSGCFDLSQAVSLEDLAIAAASGGIDRLLLPPITALGALTRVAVGPDEQHRLIQGQPVPAAEHPATVAGYAVDPQDELVAILRFDDENALWWPSKVFAHEQGNSEPA